MKMPEEVRSYVPTAVLLFALASAVAYVFGEESIFRPPASRSRLGNPPGQTERKTETETRENGERPAGRRLQAQEMVLIAK